jgi:hypothetical protein
MFVVTIKSEIVPGLQADCFISERSQSEAFKFAFWFNDAVSTLLDLQRLMTEVSWAMNWGSSRGVF